MPAETTGVWFTNVLKGEAYATNAVAHNGAGVAVGDIDSDGWQDIYFCNLQGPNRLYRGMGNWRFNEQDPGEAACADQFSTGATFADVDGDGDLDLLVNSIGAGTRLFLNDGKGGFTESKDSGLSSTASATSLALADVDGDGDLDLYVTHYIDQMHLLDPTTRFSIMRRDGRLVVLKVNDQPTTTPRLKDRFEVLPGGRVRELPEVDGFYRNDGKGRFTAIQHEPGMFSDEDGQPMPAPRDWGLSVMFRDLNHDLAPDFYVCNDNASPDRIWINSGKGTFRLIDRYNFRHTSRSSMGLDFADVNRDGHHDLLVLDMIGREHEKRMTQLVKDFPDPAEREQLDARPRYNRNTLFFGRPDGTFAEVALMAGVPATDWSWCPIFLDVDLDGYEDLLVSNGFESDVMDQDRKDELTSRGRRLSRAELMRPMEFYPRWRTANAAFRNRRDGTFEPMDREWGFNQTGVSQGTAVGDLDNDGDLDLVANNLNHTAGLYRNNASSPRIAVRLKGAPPNTQGTGASIRLLGEAVNQSQEMICGGRYFSGDQAIRVFAADPKSVKPLTLEVVWRNGGRSVITNPQPNRVYEIDQPGAVAGARIVQHGTEAKPWFKDVSSLLGHTHIEGAFDDWAEQGSLPRRLSRLGPGVTWYDFDGDGWEDLVVTSGKGGKLALFQNEQGKSFRPLSGPPTATGDQIAVVGWSHDGPKRQLLVGISNFEMRPGAESGLELYSITNLGTPTQFAAGQASLGSIALGDIDRDGDLDLFVGGRFRPGRYPEPVSSALWLNEGGSLKPSPSASAPLANLGLVTGATFVDLDGDGWLDLALALEWGPVRVLRNNQGRFEDMTSGWGLSDRTGWWACIAAGDFDGDGRLDLAVGNWGRNSMYELNGADKQGVFFGDWNSDERTDLIEAWQRGTNWYPVHNRFWLATILPELANRFPTHAAFGKATVKDILGERFQGARRLEATELRSGILLNRGSRFEWVPLPGEAQLSPAFALCVGDFDADGVEDLFLSQNCFSAVPEIKAQEAVSREDSGRGLWLRGSGRGQFAAIDGSESGIKVYGEQRGAALCDFNHDGQVDLVVSQNSSATRLFANQSGKRGLRVRLLGTAGNPDAIGAQVRIRYRDDYLGPCRSVSLRAAEVLGCAGEPVAVWVRWPDGKEQDFSVERGAWDLDIRRSANGK